MIAPQETTLPKSGPSRPAYDARPSDGEQGATSSAGQAVNGASPAPLAGDLAAPPSTAVHVTVERITYQNEENGYTVAKVVRESGAAFTVVGDLLGVAPGEAIEVTGFWQHHPEHGRQLKAISYKPVLPATIEGIRKYLGSGLIKGIGPVTAKRVVEAFGEGTFDVIESHPAKLEAVPGIGPKRVGLISQGWAEQKAIKDVMVLLAGLGVNPSMAVRIYREYGDAAVGVVMHEPYRLARDVWGIGFKTADKIALAQGLPTASPQRAQAGLLYALQEAADEGGHCYLPRAELVGRAAVLLAVESERVEDALGGILASGDAVEEQVGEDDAIYHVKHYRTEVAVARRLRRLQDWPLDRLDAFRGVKWDSAFGWLDQKEGVGLAAGQMEAARGALTEKVVILTGGPGTGKSTTVRSVVQLARAKRRTVVLAAPTGRAAKRLTELTGLEAKTVHRLLGLRVAGQAQFDEDNPLEADLVVVDEASMLDLFLFNNLLKAVPLGAHLLLVGDADQLPAVGAGNVLADLLGSGAVATVRLETIFRQAESSAIVANAHRINVGDMPRHGPPIEDFFFFPSNTPEEAADLVLDVVSSRIPRRFSVLPEEIQVLCPMHRGPAGVATLNQRLQEALNPPKPGRPEVRLAGRVFRVGDRVIALQNDYNLEVFNGDLGVVTRIDSIDHVLTVRLEDGRTVDFEFAQADLLSHAWALSVHKSQGSEFRAVVVVLLTAHYPMLARNLLYTAITRARELVVLVGQKRAIGIAVKNNRVARRNSGLAARLAAATARPAGA